MDTQKANRERRKMLTDKRLQLQRQMELDQIEQELAETEDDHLLQAQPEEQELEEPCQVMLT